MRVEQRSHQLSGASNAPRTAQRLQRFDHRIHPRARQDRADRLVNHVDRRARAGELCGADHRWPHADSRLPRIDHGIRRRGERLTGQRGVLQVLAQTARYMNRHDPGRSLLERDLVGGVEVVHRRG